MQAHCLSVFRKWDSAKFVNTLLVGALFFVLAGCKSTDGAKPQSATKPAAKKQEKARKPETQPKGPHQILFVLPDHGEMQRLKMKQYPVLAINYKGNDAECVLGTYDTQQQTFTPSYIFLVYGHPVQITKFLAAMQVPGRTLPLILAYQWQPLRVFETVTFSPNSDRFLPALEREISREKINYQLIWSPKLKWVASSQSPAPQEQPAESPK